MAVPQNRTELLAAIDLTFNRLLQALDDMSPGHLHDKAMEGHASNTMMSVADLISYLLGWNELVLKWLARDAQGLPVEFPETGFKWNQLGLLAQKFYADYESLPDPERIARLKAAQARIVAHIQATPDAVLYGQSWYGKWTMGRMIQFNTSSPYANARMRLKRFSASLKQGNAEHADASRPCHRR